MRGQPNRQTISTTARWNFGQSDPSSAGAQHKPLEQRQTGQGTNLNQLKRALAAAELAFAQSTDPRTRQNLEHGIDLIKAQMLRATGGDHLSLDLSSVPESSTGYEFSGRVEGTDFESTEQYRPAVEQSPISSFAAFQLAGTIRQRITKVEPHKTLTPAGFPVHPGVNPRERSNVIRTPNNPDGSVFQMGDPSEPGSDLTIETDTRDSDYRGQFYNQGFTPGTHDNVYVGRGVVPSRQFLRGKHGQYPGGYSYASEQSQSGAE